jgi:hypothetical protein
MKGNKKLHQNHIKQLNITTTTHHHQTPFMTDDRPWTFKKPFDVAASAVALNCNNFLRSQC